MFACWSPQYSAHWPRKTPGWSASSHSVVQPARDEIDLALQLRDPQAVDDVVRQQVDGDRTADRNVNLVGRRHLERGRVVGILDVPPPLVAGHLDAHRVRHAQRRPSPGRSQRCGTRMPSSTTTVTPVAMPDLRRDLPVAGPGRGRAPAAHRNPGRHRHQRSTRSRRSTNITPTSGPTRTASGCRPDGAPTGGAASSLPPVCTGSLRRPARLRHGRQLVVVAPRSRDRLTWPDIAST